MKTAGALILASALVLVVAASGCVVNGGSQISSGQGVVIENFETDFQRIYAGENFKIQLKIRNVGSVDANRVTAKLYNTETGDFGSNQYEISCSDACGQAINMLAPDPDRGTIGESRTCIWDCEAPSTIPKGLSMTFNPSVRMYYNYATSTIKSINIISQDELRSLQTQGKSPPSETISTTSGPVQMDVVVKGPIRFWEGDPAGNRIRFPININIQNTGGGVTCGQEGPGGITGCEDENNWDKVRFVNQIDDPETHLICENSDTGSFIISLWKGQSASLTCEIDMAVPGEGTVGFIQKNLKFQIEYDYIADATTSVEVVGRDI